MAVQQVVENSLRRYQGKKYHAMAPVYYYSILYRMISSHCLVQIEGNQASSEPLPFRGRCTAREYFHANSSVVHVTASPMKFITCEIFMLTVNLQT